MSSQKTPRITAILPVRLLPSAKQRLEDLLDDSARHTLVLAMLKDALDATMKAKRIDNALVVTTDAELESAADLSAAEVIVSRSGTLNGDLLAGLRQVAAAGTQAALVLLPDLPLLTGRTIDALLRAAGRKTHVVIATDWKGTGTNALYLRPPNIMPPQFGPNSVANHLALAQQTGLKIVRFVTKETSLDLDDAEAVMRFVEAAANSPTTQATRTFRVLSQLLKLPRDSRSWVKSVLTKATRYSKRR